MGWDYFEKSARIYKEQISQAVPVGAFVTNSLIGVMPLTAVNGKSIGRGMGPLTRRLLSAYRKRLSPQR